MNKLHGGIALAIAATLASCRAAEMPIRTEPPVAELARFVREQARIVQSGDMRALADLLHPDYVIHLPNGRIVDRAVHLEFAASGRLRAERFERTQERVVAEGPIGLVMGVDRLESPPGLAERGERTRRYTNVYVREGGRWRQLALHFHFLP